MPNYALGKVYKITGGGLIYIGSTCEPTLARRLAGHVGSYKQGKSISSSMIIETGQYEITLIELYPCSSKDELHSRERFHIEQNVCVNKAMPGRGRKESLIVAVKKWRKNNPDAYKAKYQKDNDKVKDYNAFAYQLRQIPKRLI